MSAGSGSVYTLRVTFEITGEIWYWKGPAPHHFVTVPAKEAADIKALERSVSYGWGMIPVEVRVGGTEFKTALWPKDGLYIVPLKDKVRKAEGLQEGDTVTVRFEVVQSV